MGFWGNFFGGEKRALPWNISTDPARLRAARLTLKKSQETTARILGVSHFAYSRWENGHATPAPDRREKLWKLINLADKMAGKEV